jgi:flagellar basal-body rod protein FlgC
MSFFDGYDIAISGMSTQRVRVNISSANIANAQTTHTKNGGPYKKQNVIFEELLSTNTNSQNSNDNGQLKVSNLKGVRVKEIVDSKSKPILKYEPDHPDANKDGYVAYPNINSLIEMIDFTEALRSYEANISSFQTQKTIDTKTLDILKG